MYALNGLFLVFLAFALRRVFNAGVALGTLLFLMIDPTVAAHLPVVMTDLPVGLLSATAVVLATRAFRDWIWTDLAACSLFLGLALTAKHSAPVVALSVALIGTGLALGQPILEAGDARWRRLLKVAAVLVAALAVLWGSYLFRYTETRSAQEAFNRPLAAKIKDVGTPFYHAVLSGMAATRVVPRAYLWGFADTVHAGMEGRPFPQLVLGHLYMGRGPRYFFPVILAVKVPIGLSVLSLLGLVLFFARRLPAEWNFPAGVILAGVLLFLLVLSAGATYAGVRHAMPVLILVAIFGGLFAERAWVSHSKAMKTIAVLAYAMACVSALPVLRPWEYFNEFAGGTKNARNYFSDEGVDLCQRTKEIAAYYHKFLKPAGEIATIFYFSSEEELKGRDVDYLGRDMQRDMERLSSPERSGTIFAGNWSLLPTPFWDSPELRAVKPVARLGNLLVFRGDFHLPARAASSLYWEGVEKLYADKPDEAAAEKAFRRSAELDPKAYFVHIELGNMHLKRGEKDAAWQEYSAALKYAPENKLIRQSIEEQVQRVTREPLANVAPLRNPFLE